MDFARHDGFGFQFYSSTGADNPVEPPTDDYVVAIDLTLHRSMFSQNQRFFGDESSLHRRVDAKRAARLKSALKFYAGL